MSFEAKLKHTRSARREPDIGLRGPSPDGESNSHVNDQPIALLNA